MFWVFLRLKTAVRFGLGFGFSGRFTAAASSGVADVGIEKSKDEGSRLRCRTNRLQPVG